MATKTTGARQPKTTGQQEAKQGQRLPSIRADINWMNPNEDENVRANASVTIGGAFAVHGLRVMNHPEKGDWVSMPSYKGQNGYKDIFHAITADARQQMNDAVLNAYEQKLAEQMEQEQGEALDESQDAGMQGMNQ